MIHRLSIAFGLCLALAATGCTTNRDIPSQPPGGETAVRTLASMLPAITKSLTPLLAEQTFGPADAKSGSGPINYVYNVEDQKKVNLTFPGPTATISFASLQDRNGVTTPITIGN
ncbi:MAG: hypothetical protein ACJ79A_02585 [Gemmatimonadaceae bacterium]